MECSDCKHPINSHINGGCHYIIEYEGDTKNYYDFCECEGLVITGHWKEANPIQEIGRFNRL